MSPAKTQPALLGGVLMGVLSALPVVSLGNCACCAWLIVGGALATYLMQQNHPEPVSVGDGAIAGLLAGVFGAIVWAVVSVPLSMVMGGAQSQMLEQVMANSEDMPPEVRDLLQNLGTSGAMGVASIVGIIFMMCLTTAFGMVGGILGALIFKKNAPPPPPPPPSFTPPTGFGSGGSHSGHTFRPPTFNPPPPPNQGS